jgi:1-acyl-sn-glycerol-3-phosphate acyltransferase
MPRWKEAAVPTWYHRAAWSLLRKLKAPLLLRTNRVEAEFLDPEPNGPYLLVANHGHRADAWVLGSLLGRTIRYMANLEGVSPTKAFFAELVGAYGKRKGMPDLAALRRTLDLARSGETIGIFPEGDRSWDGSFQGIKPGLGRLIKLIKLPVLMARQEGSYLSAPRWARHERQGQWQVRFKLLPIEEILHKSPEELERSIEGWIAGDGPASAANFYCKAPAEGAERVLWLCPACGALHSIRSRGAELFCRDCSAVWRIDANQRIRWKSQSQRPHADLPTLQSWIALQAEAIRLRTAYSPQEKALLPPDRATLWQRDERGWQALGKRSIALTKDSIRLIGIDTRKNIALKSAEGFVDHFNRYVEFSGGGQRYRVRFDQSCSFRWIQTLAILADDEGATA